MTLDLEYPPEPTRPYRLVGPVYTSIVRELTEKEAAHWAHYESMAHATLHLRLECEGDDEDS